MHVICLRDLACTCRCHRQSVSLTHSIKCHILGDESVSKTHPIIYLSYLILYIMDENDPSSE